MSRIASLRLANFRSYGDEHIIFEPLTVFRGGNYVGKTTIVQALEISTASRSAVTDERGAGAVSLIRTGQTQGEATVEFIDNEGVTRFINCNLSLDDGRTLKVVNPEDPSSPCTDFKDWMKRNSEIFSCLIDTRRFISKSPAEQKLILANIILPDHYDFPQDRRAQCAEVGLQVDWNLPPLEVIGDDKRGAYKAAYDLRRAVNSNLKAWKIPEGDVSKAGDEKEIRTKLATRKDELTAAEKVKAAEDTAEEVWDIQRKNAEQKLTSAETRLSTEQQEADTAKKSVLSKQQIKSFELVAKGKVEGDKLTAQIVAKTAELKFKKEEHAALEELAKVKDGECPTCTQKMSPEVLTRLVAPVWEAIQKIEADIWEAQKSLKDLGDYAGAQSQLDSNKTAAEDAARIDRRIAQAHEDVTAARAQSEQSLTKPARTEGIDESIAKLKENVQKGDTILQERIRANQLQVAVEDAKKKKTVLDKHSEILEDLVEYFGTKPKSAMTALLSAHIEPFETAMNDRLSSWGYQCRLNFEPFVFGITRGDKTYPLHLLAESEKYMFAIAFQASLAHTSGHKFVFVDASDIFLKPARNAMMRSLMSAGLDQVVVLASDDRIDPLPSGAGPSALYMLSCEDVDNVPTTTVQRLGE